MQLFRINGYVLTSAKSYVDRRVRTPVAAHIAPFCRFGRSPAGDRLADHNGGGGRGCFFGGGRGDGSLECVGCGCFRVAGGGAGGGVVWGVQAVVSVGGSRSGS